MFFIISKSFQGTLLPHVEPGTQRLKMFETLEEANKVAANLIEGKVYNPKHDVNTFITLADKIAVSLNTIDQIEKKLLEHEPRNN
jgi:hypothetical protein